MRGKHLKNGFGLDGAREKQHQIKAKAQQKSDQQHQQTDCGRHFLLWLFGRNWFGLVHILSTNQLQVQGHSKQRDSLVTIPIGIF